MQAQISADAPVLLVEDSADDERLAIRVYESADLKHPLLIARDGMEGYAILDELKRNDQNLALVMLDLKLPKVSGFDVLERIRTDSFHKLTPVVVLTTSDELSDVVKSYEIGANAFVKKPMAFGDYKETLTRLFQFWLGANVRVSGYAQRQG